MCVYELTYSHVFMCDVFLCSTIVAMIDCVDGLLKERIYETKAGQRGMDRSELSMYDLQFPFKNVKNKYTVNWRKNS